MASFGFLEILFIFILCVILLKPEDWPDILFKIGRFLKKARIFKDHAQRSFEDFMTRTELDHFKKEKKPSLKKKNAPHDLS